MKRLVFLGRNHYGVMVIVLETRPPPGGAFLNRCSDSHSFFYGIRCGTNPGKGDLTETLSYDANQILSRWFKNNIKVCNKLFIIVATVWIEILFYRIRTQH